MKIRAVLALVTAIALLIPLAAGAESSSEETLPPRGEFPVGYHAARWGLDIEEARFQLELQDFAGVVVGEALAEYDQDVVMEMRQRPAGVTVYAAYDLERVRQIVEDTAGEWADYFNVVQAQATQAELEERAQLAWEAMPNKGLTVGTIAFDIRNGVVEIRTPDPVTARNEVPVPGVLYEEGSAVQDEIEGYGGWHIGSVGCTVGFVANSGAGYITAGHCPDTHTDARHPNGSPVVNVTFSHDDWNDDVQYDTYDSPDHGGRFSWIGWTHQAVWSKTWSHPLNATVCHYGRATGNQCGSITKTSSAKPYPYSSYFVEATCSCSNFSANGDSGGPWYSGSTAYGIHSGSEGYGPTAVYQKVTRAESELGVTLWEH